MPLVHRGYSVYIKSEGKELPQFQVEVVDERTVTCWIPSEAGKSFIGCFTPVERHDHEYIVANLFADGQLLYGLGYHDEYQGKEGTIVHRSVSETEGRPFFFSAVHLTSDDNASGSSNDAPEDLATIVMEIWVAELTTRATPYVYIPEDLAADADIRITERSKLLDVNQVKLGAIETSEQPDGFSCNAYTQVGEHPYAVFRFKHHPAGVLQAMGIMPRPRPISHSGVAPTSSSSTPKRSNDASNVPQKRPRVKEEEAEVEVQPVNDEEVQAKRRRMKAKIAAERAEAAAHEAKALALEAELEEFEATARAGRTRVKSERGPSPIRLLQSGGVVDLTDD